MMTATAMPRIACLADIGTPFVGCHPAQSSVRPSPPRAQLVRAPRSGPRRAPTCPDAATS
jgi:hypothetical protein